MINHKFKKKKYQKEEKLQITIKNSFKKIQNNFTKQKEPLFKKNSNTQEMFDNRKKEENRTDIKPSLIN